MSTKIEPKPAERALALPSSEKLERLDELARQYSSAFLAADNPFSSSITLAIAMRELRELMTPEIMAPIMELMNSPLGFLTDRTGKANWKGETKPLYTVEQVRDSSIEAILRGFALCGNEFNIIAERFYGAKAGFARRVKTFPGVSDYKDGFSAPRAIGEKGSCVVACWASWRKGGAESRVDREFVVKGDQYATADSYLGKAQRKLSAAVYERLSGHYVPEGEVSDDDLAKAKQANVVVPNFSNESEPEIAAREEVKTTEPSGEQAASGSEGSAGGGAANATGQPAPAAPAAKSVQEIWNEA